MTIFKLNLFQLKYISSIRGLPLIVSAEKSKYKCKGRKY